MRIDKQRFKLTGELGEQLFGSAIAFDGDYSLSALFRAIALENEGTDAPDLEFKCSVTKTSIDSEGDAKFIFRDFQNAIVVAEVRGSYFPDSLEVEGWTALDGAPCPVNKYLSQIAKTRIFSNTEQKRLIAFVEKRASGVWARAFMATLVKSLSWYFPAKPTPEVISFFQTINIENKKMSDEEIADTIVRYVDGIADKLDFRALSMHKYLDGYMDRVRDNLIRDGKSKVESITRDINTYHDALGREYANLELAIQQLAAYENTSSQASTALFDFFNSHKQLTVLSLEEGKIKYGIDETIEYYDEDEFDNIFENDDSYLNEYANDDTKKVMWAIFHERKGCLRTNSVFTLAALRQVSPKSHETFINDAIPQPHISWYGCSGANDTYYSQYAKTGEWELAVEQSIAATKNLNFGDSTVGEKTVKWLNDHKNIPCIYVDGNTKLITIKQFLKNIEEGEQNG